MDPQSVLLAVCAVLLTVAAAALLAARSSRAECGRLRQETAEALRATEGARAEAQVLRVETQGQARSVAERDERLAQVARDLEALRAQHGDAERRCATAVEAVGRLEAAAERLRADHGEAVRLLREEGARAAERLRSVEEEFSRLGASHAALLRERAERDASHEREVARLREVREEMKAEFQALAAATLRETGPQFSEAHHQKLQELLTPFREQVGRFETELRTVHAEAGKDRAVLHEQIRALTTQTQAVSQDAANLARALKGEKHRQGAWGEAQLEQYLEHMGYVKGVHYRTQESRTDESGDRWRPDVILKLPGERCIVIDSKVSLVAYAAALAADGEEERARHLREHVRAVKTHIDTLSAKGYQNLEDGSVDWVLLFMPIEGAVSAAWAHEADIAAYAIEKRIGLAYPTTLLMALRTVKHLWDVENRNQNAESIAERAGLLYDKLAGFIESFSTVGKALGQAQAAHERALGQLSKGSGNLVGQVEKLRKLGAKTSKSLSLAFDAEPEETVLGLEEEVVPTHEPRGLPAE